MQTTLGQLLRQQRKARRLTLEQTARAAGISRVTLNRWETGANQPRVAELEAVLKALDTDARQRRKALTLIEAPRARTLVRQEVNRIAEQVNLGPMPHGGSLLEAMRQRRGLSLEALAQRMGVTTLTLRRWEKAEMWPSVERLHALCYALQAQEEEIIALTCGRFAMLPVGETVSLEELRQRLDVLWGLDPHAPLIDLHWLTLEAQLWPHASRDVSGRDLLAEAYATHADHLCARSEWKAMGVYAERAMDLMPDKAPREPFWIKAGMAAAHFEVNSRARPSPRRGVEMLSHWLPLVQEPAYEAWIFSRLAEYQMQDRRVEEALSLAARACRIAERSEHPMERRWRQRDWAFLLVEAGRPMAALTVLLPEDGDTVTFGADLALWRVQTLLSVGETTEAHDWLLRARSVIEQNALEQVRGVADTLSQQF
jgi:transcriptional regulator with XRE-family HTH domain